MAPGVGPDDHLRLELSRTRGDCFRGRLPGHLGVLLRRRWPSVVGLATNAMFPILSVPVWAVSHSLIAFLFVWVGRYQLFENVMKVLILCKVVIVVVIAALLRPDLGEIASGLVPKVPAGSLLYAVGIVGGLGGTLARLLRLLGARQGWRSPSWVPIMRLDAGTRIRSHGHLRGGGDGDQGRAALRHRKEHW